MARGTKNTRNTPRPWTRFDDRSLLEVRLCDLGLRLEETPLVARLERLDGELGRRGLAFTPHCWLSTDWFSPDGLAGFAIPFYLAHPRLRRLERTQMMHAEGEDLATCMRLLRHECGHAIDSAYRLHQRRDWRETFGRYSTPYRSYYTPGPQSQEFVQHLDRWYAQSHPAEDFCETFAVWLDPRSKWRERYAGWPALAKLEYVDGLMTEIAGRKPRVRGRSKEDDVSGLETTLGQFYARRKKRYRIEAPRVDERDLERLFGKGARARLKRPGKRADTLLEELTPELLERVHACTGENYYTVYQILRSIADRASELDLRVRRPRAEVARDAALLLTVQTMDYLHSPMHRRAR